MHARRRTAHAAGPPVGPAPALAASTSVELREKGKHSVVRAGVMRRQNTLPQMAAQQELFALVGSGGPSGHRPAVVNGAGGSSGSRRALAGAEGRSGRCRRKEITSTNDDDWRRPVARELPRARTLDRRGEGAAVDRAHLDGHGPCARGPSGWPRVSSGA